MAKTKTYYLCVRTTTRLEEGGSKTEYVTARIHDVAQSSLDQLERSYSIERNTATILVLVPRSQSMKQFKGKGVEVDFSIDTHPSDGVIFERGLRIDPSTYPRGLDIREGLRYLFVLDPNHSLPPAEKLMFNLFRFLGIDLTEVQ